MVGARARVSGVALCSMLAPHALLTFSVGTGGAFSGFALPFTAPALREPETLFQPPGRIISTGLFASAQQRESDCELLQCRFVLHGKKTFNCCFYNTLAFSKRILGKVFLSLQKTCYVNCKFMLIKISQVFQSFFYNVTCT